MRLGILGGTFNPIHYGHLRVAEEILEEMNLDKVFIMPGGHPPHKDLKNVAPFCDRLEMARIGAGDSSNLEVIDIEGKRKGFSYSIETLKEIHEQYNDNLDLFFILGSDAFKEIKTWKEYKKLFDLTNFIVLKRPGISSSDITYFIESLNLNFKKSGTKDKFTGPMGKHIFFKNVTMLDISSTKIREAIIKGKSINYLVPEKVKMYIEKKGLYLENGIT
ncbi:nicotinate-nucleotide adenylyltransferase [Thermodesulfobacteriota bacterium]